MLRTLTSRVLGARLLHTTQPLHIDPKTVEEVRIPVPWGHIAGKWWERKGGTPIIAVHGWQDNAGSWDPLMQHLPNDCSVLAIDMPGHGLSSHLPPFMRYTVLQGPDIFKRVINFMGQDKVHLLGHSGGSNLCFLFGCVFPEHVISYCGVDYVLFASTNEARRVSHGALYIDNFLRMAMREHSNARSYEWEDAKMRWVKSTGGSVSPKSADILMQRGTTTLPNGKVTFNRDNRIKLADITLFDIQQWTSFIETFSANTCFMKGRHSEFFHRGIRRFPTVLELIKNKCKLYEFHNLDGGHHFHMDFPDVVAQVYYNFLNRVQAES